MDTYLEIFVEILLGTGAVLLIFDEQYIMLQYFGRAMSMGW